MEVVHHSSLPASRIQSFAVPFEEVNRLAKSRHPPLDTLSGSLKDCTLDKICSFNSAVLKLVLYPFSRAAAPETKGVAIDAPLSGE